VQDSTLEATDYIFVFTSLSTEQYPAARVLELYRCRWQVELAFNGLMDQNPHNRARLNTSARTRGHRL
jgi:Transposase DDE domain